MVSFAVPGPAVCLLSWTWMPAPLDNVVRLGGECKGVSCFALGVLAACVRFWRVGDSYFRNVISDGVQRLPVEVTDGSPSCFEALRKEVWRGFALLQRGPTPQSSIHRCTSVWLRECFLLRGVMVSGLVCLPLTQDDEGTNRAEHQGGAHEHQQELSCSTGEGQSRQT